jgi:hypothetical protein
MMQRGNNMRECAIREYRDYDTSSMLRIGFSNICGTNSSMTTTTGAGRTVFERRLTGRGAYLANELTCLYVFVSPSLSVSMSPSLSLFLSLGLS